VSTPTEILKATLAALDEAHVPEGLREVAFSKIFDLLTGGGPPAANSTASPATGASATGSGAPTSTGLAGIATAMKIEPGLIGDFFTEEDGDIRLNLHDSELGSNIRDKVGNGALLIVAGRHFGGFENGSATKYSMIRTQLERYGLTDSNFSANLRKVSSYFTIGGSGNSATYKLRSPGRTAVMDLAKHIVESR
jgi:hypothetical protein